MTALLNRSFPASAMALTASLLMGVCLVGAAIPGTAHAADTAPALTGSDEATLTAALKACDQDDWATARTLETTLTDPVAAKIARWTRLMAQDSGASASEIASFQAQNPQWPRQKILSQRAEEAFLLLTAGTPDTLAWFTRHTPVTADGRIAYGEALVATGKKNEGADTIMRAWIDGDFTVTEQQGILARDGALIPMWAHEARFDRLLWDGDYSDARRMVALLGPDEGTLADARVQLMSGSFKAPDALSRVPDYLRRNGGLLYAQARYERKVGDPDAALPILLTAPTQGHQMVSPADWWVERRIAARQMLVEGRYAEAYKLVSENGLSSGSDFADAEFMSGWIALQYLNKPQQALPHFQQLDAGVSTPVSKSRAKYWLGRTEAALGNKDEALKYYRQASQYSTSFYGQLALSELAGPGRAIKLQLPPDPATSATTEKHFAKTELARAARMALQISRPNLARTFVLHMGDTLSEPAQLAELADFAMSIGLPDMSVRVSKVAAQRGVIMPVRAYPVSVIPNYARLGPQVEPALVYGISRQESEFNPQATSSAGALGLMQLMPGTAKIVARQVGVPYSTARLTTDPSYNATLGSAHLGDLAGKYDGSYIMTIAAYNAGGGRVTQWIGKYGDPRAPSVDPIDWIEQIPFTETRNYVQRVMENVQVYRNRLSGKNMDLAIAADLRRASSPAFAAMPATVEASDDPADAPAPMQSAPAQLTPSAQPPAAKPAPLAPPARSSLQLPFKPGHS
ncbi:MAG: transglycosylase SLT domain-containing protein [Parvibaculaceae bacterium]|nr:transglycosylase SLT domain-containing protein [Parvibaculaceae bacterium]